MVHFLREGAAKGYRPSALFDPAYYRAQAGEGALVRVGSEVLHYALVGRHKGFSSSPYFDVRYYLEANPDVVRSGMDPLLHFLRFGGAEGRNPSRQFDTRDYLARHGALHARRINPLVHYVTSGADARVPGEGLGAKGAVQAIPPWQEWAAHLPARSAAAAEVDIVVPVYRDKDLTLRCIYSVLTSPVKTGYELVVIDDQSPDADLVQALRGLASRGLITLLANPVNQGYVHSANRGMQLHPDRDVVQLNSDAEVFNDWLDRLRAAAYRDLRVATVTPLSNNATICSYPGFNRDNHDPLELGYPELDLLASAANGAQAVEAPTGVGFCLYIRRDCIDEVGLFDQEAFGRGYGEENDFCQRARKRNWRNLIACDVFVRHHGSASFQGDRHALIVHAMQKLHQLHPNYHKDVALFIRTDPLAAQRERLDRARLERAMRASNVLLLSHDLGGGTERFVREEATRLRDAGHGVFLARPSGEHSLAIGTDLSGPLINLPPVRCSHAGLRELAGTLKIGEIQLHHVLGLDIGVVDALAELAESGAVRLKVYVHDYLAICPRINLVDASGRYCGEPGPAGCDKCLKANGSRYGIVAIEPWRARFARLLRAATGVVVPDRDVAARLRRYFDAVRIEVQPHEPLQPTPPVQRRAPPGDAAPVMKVAVIGAISPIKGLQVLLDCARDAMERELPLQFVVLGYTSDDTQAAQRRIEVTGRYREEDAQNLLAALGADAVFLPSVWPETYSYTLSVAMRAGLPVFAFDIGAIASRLRSAGAADNLIHLEAAGDPAGVNDFILEKGRSLCEQPVP